MSHNNHDWLDCKQNNAEILLANFNILHHVFEFLNNNPDAHLIHPIPMIVRLFVL